MKIIILSAALAAVLAAGLLAGCSQPAPVATDEGKQAAQSSPADTIAPADTTTPYATSDNGTVAAAADEGPQTARIADILQDARGWDGKKVVVEGKIASECPSGCWFTLKDGNAVIYIDLAPSNLVIPQRKGSYAKVTAKVVAEGSDVYLIGTRVDF
jgi:hypothetical protein